jgi:hypothetical protein
LHCVVVDFNIFKLYIVKLGFHSLQICFSAIKCGTANYNVINYLAFPITTMWPRVFCVVSFRANPAVV